jgi:hypothetical protein
MSERLWRVRKHHTWIDARIGMPPAEREDARVELTFFYDGELVFATRCASRDAAVVEADRRLRDLQRAGWNTHW